MDNIIAVFNGTADWSFWFIIATLVDFIILYISLVYTVYTFFWDMGWSKGFNLQKFIIQKDFKDLETRMRIKKIKDALKNDRFKE